MEPQDSGEEISEDDVSVDGDPAIDPVSIIAMQKQMRVLQKSLARLTAKSVHQQSKANVAQETAAVGPASTTSNTSGEAQD